jgi:hypothetical protein
VFVVRVVLSVRGLCDGLITRPDESYRLWCVMCNLLTDLVNEEAMAHWRLCQKQTNKLLIQRGKCFSRPVKKCESSQLHSYTDEGKTKNREYC